MTLEWRKFGPRTLEEAKAQGKPILMVLTVPWCAHSRELLETSFADPRVIEAVTAHYIPVRVDADRRPDVNDRYGTGGWPTIAYLTPAADLITQDRFLGADDLHAQVLKIADQYTKDGARIDEGIRELWDKKSDGAHRGGSLSTQIVDDVIDAIYEKFDHRYGGWGEGSKFPHPEAIDFALVNVAKRQDQRMKEVVTLTLDKMMEGAIHDPIDGAFFRFSKTPDWRSPNFEKVIDGNAQRLRCYLEAYQLFGNEAYRAASEGIVRWMLDFMLDEDSGAFYGSLEDDADYYALNEEDRRRREPPRTDETIYTNWNSMVISSLLKASVVLERPELRERATRALHFLIENVFDGQGTVYHYWDGTYHLPGLLADQAYLIRALIDVSQHSGNADLLLPAEAIADLAMERQRSPDGGFFDILQDNAGQGSMRRRNLSILENSVMAESLVRLSYLTRRSEFYEEAIRTLESFSADYKEFGYYVAAYGRAVDLVFYPPLIVTIVGDRESADADALRQAALVSYMPSRIVQMLDPKYDPVLLQRSGYAASEKACAHITIGNTDSGSTEDPAELLAKMEAIETERRFG